MWVYSFRPAIVIGLIASTCFAGDDAKRESEAHLGRLLLAGVRDSRERLRKGLVHAHIDPVDDLEVNPSWPSSQATSFFAAFDADERLLRFDYTRRARFPHGDGERSLGDTGISEVTQHHIRTPDRWVQFVQVSDTEAPGEITIYRRDEALPSGVKLYDTRAIGLLTAGAFQRHWELAEVFDRVYNAIPPTEVADEGAGIWKLCGISGDGGYRYCLWVDRAHGFTPIRLEESARAVPSARERPNRWPWSTVFASDTTWEQINDVWVPVRWHIADHKGGTTSWSFAYRLEWESVNERPPVSLFAVESLGAPKGTLITNAMGPQPFIERVVGVPNSALDGTVFGTKGTVRRVSWSNLQVALIVVAALLAILLVVASLRGRHRRPHA
jgi:hypothetical protein